MTVHGLEAKGSERFPRDRQFGKRPAAGLVMQCTCLALATGPTEGPSLANFTRHGLCRVADRPACTYAWFPFDSGEFSCGPRCFSARWRGVDACQFVNDGTQPKATPVNAGLHQGSDTRCYAGGAADREGEVAEFEMQAIPMVETFGERIEFF